ncbi:MAG: hypothetical protein JSV91_13995 [Phycisphaerales bacterium]|nr:MAG: hypothetical protein JSV91_13995 [Phycisphaerales bacterium]
MDEAEFRTKFKELLERIGEMPPEQRPRLEALAAETRRRHEETREAVDRANAALRNLTLTLQLALLKA